MLAVLLVVAVERGRRVRWEVKRRRRGRMVVGVRKLIARMMSETIKKRIEGFDRRMLGCIGRRWNLLAARALLMWSDACRNTEWRGLKLKAEELGIA